MTVDSDALQQIAKDCVSLVQAEFGRTLSWGLDSLEDLDRICETLTAGGQLTGERFDLWWKVIGAYVGQVVNTAYGGQWVTHELAEGAYAVQINGAIGFPFAYTQRVLEGEPFKSLASFGGVFPHLTRERPDTADESQGS